MSVAAAPAIFDVFNARQLTPQQVAGSFVPPPHFANLVKPTHTLIVGPRGSGKTTLLKMLHPAALEAWAHDDAAKFRKDVTFTGVFIATDINWNEQIRSLGEGRLDAETHKQFTRAAFTTQVLQSLVESMFYRSGKAGPASVSPHRRVNLSQADESDIATELIQAWEIDRSISSFEGLRVALARRLSKIRQLASMEASLGEYGRLERMASRTFLYIDFLSAAGVAVELFNAKAKELAGRWALLFDELELAPAWMRTMLVRYLRSVDDRFLFKISLSPYSVDLKREMDESANGAGARQDFEPIRLWYVNKEQGYPFCRELLKGMLAARGVTDLSAESLFGVSDFSTEEEDFNGKKTAYHPQSRVGRMFRQLASKDPSFRDYLDRRKITLSSMHTLSSPKRAADLRKARSIVSLRTYFRFDGEDIQKERAQGRRSRKVPTVYGGATSLFAMVEGNPRWFIGIVGQLLSRSKTAGTPLIPKAAQVRQVVEAANIFRAMLRTIPFAGGGPSRRGLLSLLDPVGAYFAHAAIDANFDPDPPCSFQVDSLASDEELRALGMALNAGAIIYAPGEGDLGLLENLRGKRFRLSFILAPHYFIPLVLGRTMSLHQILDRAGKDIRRTLEESSGPTLFSSVEDQNASSHSR